MERFNLYVKDPYEVKYQFLINKRKSTGLRHLNGSKAFIEYSNDKDDVYEIIEEHIPNKKHKILIVLWWYSNKKLNPIVTELLIRGRKLNIFLVLFTESGFAVLKSITLNPTHYFIMKIPQKRKCREIVFNHLSDIEFIEFVNLYKKFAIKPYYFLVIGDTRASHTSLRFRKNLLGRI